VQIALAQHDVVLAADFDLVAVFRAEQDAVADLGTAHVLPERDHLGPYEPLRHLRRGGDDDAAHRTALTLPIRDVDEQPIVEHLDRELLVGGHGRHGTVCPMPIETVMIDALDGVRLRADLARVDGAAAGVVLTHPHPLYGGDRFNPIIETLFAMLPAAGLTTIRFDFRGVNESGGAHDDGDSERLDVVAAIELLDFVQADQPVWLVGYSFGALVALNVVDPRVAGWIAIAPPLAAFPGRTLSDTDHRPKLMLVPQHDQYTPPDTMAAIIESWQATEMRTIESCDHFLVGRVQTIAETVVASLSPFS
jgi:alpha/beta superfamily hydrolase